MASQNIEANIHSFYSAFSKKDFSTMQGYYAEKVNFTDPVFVGLKDNEVGAMWEMILGRASDDFSVTYKIKSIGDKKAQVDWIAKYTLSQTGNQITNHVQSSIDFDDDGKIINQVDEFDLCKWSHMGFGFFKAKLICWFPDVTIRSQVNKSLKSFIEKKSKS